MAIKSKTKVYTAADMSRAQEIGYNQGYSEAGARLDQQRKQLQLELLTAVTTLVAEQSKLASRVGYMIDKVNGAMK